MICSLCNSAISCEADSSCWCNKLPKLITVSDSSGCYCFDCLTDKIAAQVNQDIAILDEADKKKISALGVPGNLKEGIDFSINEAGNYVFSKWYLLRRSYCCKNDCRNCPY